MTALRLPVLWCSGPGCSRQLVNFLSLGPAGELLCLWCAREAAADGLPGLVRPLTPDMTPELLPGGGEPLPQDEAVRLLVRLGAQLVAPQDVEGEGFAHVCPCGRTFGKGFGLRVHQRTCPQAPAPAP